MRVGGCPVVVAQWQNTGTSSPGFELELLPAFRFPLIFLLEISLRWGKVVLSNLRCCNVNIQPLYNNGTPLSEAYLALRGLLSINKASGVAETRTKTSLPRAGLQGSVGSQFDNSKFIVLPRGKWSKAGRMSMALTQTSPLTYRKGVLATRSQALWTRARQFVASVSAKRLGQL